MLSHNAFIYLSCAYIIVRGVDQGVPEHVLVWTKLGK